MKKSIEFKKFVTHRCAHRALLDGKILKTCDGHTVFYDEKEGGAFRINKGGADEEFVYGDDLITHEEVEWYDDVLEHGVLCWVWNDDESLKVPAFVYSYNPQYPLRFKCCPDTSSVRELDDYLFKNAAPMNGDEVLLHIIEV